ncbi:MAG: hypothetical protein ACRDJE_04860 [Dehalococcoidia bacterium]
MDPRTHDLLVAGCGRGFTVLCTLSDTALLDALGTIAGSTGLVLAVGPAPPAGSAWAAVRCDPAHAIPLRSHVVDAAVIQEAADLADLAEEVRRVLVPGGDVRVLLTNGDDATSALESASIRVVEHGAGVLIARGP